MRFQKTVLPILLLFILTNLQTTCRTLSPLRQHTDSVLVSVRMAWQALEKADKEKFAQIDLVLKQVSKFAQYNKNQYDSAKFYYKKTLANRLTAQNLAESEQIDRYDQATERLINYLKELRSSLEPPNNLGTINAALAIIQDLDEGDLRRRVDYDSQVEALNKIIKEQAQELKKMNGKYKNLKTIPTFQIAQ